jgi:integrase
MAGKRGSNEGSISRRADGLWEARITLPDGRRKSLYAKTRQEAARKLAEAIRDRDKGLPVVTDRQTVEQYFLSWLSVMRAKVRRSTWRKYETYVRLHILPTLGKVTLAKLTAQQLQELYARKLAEGLGRTSVRHVHAVIHRALDAAIRLELVQRNVSDLVDPPSRDRPEMAVLSPAQARGLLEAARGDRFEALYVLALTTGMREGELLALRWQDVDLDGGTLQVRSTLQHTKTGFVFSEPKTAHSRRRIALPTIAVHALRRHHTLQAAEKLALGPAWRGEYDLVFPSVTGGPMDDSHFRRREFATLLRRAKLPHVRFHDLRHTAATLLFTQRVNAKVVSEMLGHSGIAITLGLYGHVTPPMQQAAADAMDSVFEQKGLIEDSGKGDGTDETGVRTH